MVEFSLLIEFRIEIEADHKILDRQCKILIKKSLFFSPEQWDKTNNFFQSYLIWGIKKTLGIKQAYIHILDFI